MFGIPSVFLFFLFFGVVYRIVIFYGSVPLSKNIIFSVFVIISITLMFFDYKNYDYVTGNNDELREDFSFFDKLEWDDQIGYKSCVLSLGPIPKDFCVSLYESKKTLKLPTKDNLKERLKACHYDDLDWRPRTSREIEDIGICGDAVKELDEKGEHEAKQALFNFMLDRLNEVKDCKKRFSKSGILSNLTSFQKKMYKYYARECISNKCYYFCGTLSSSPELIKSLQNTKDDFVLYKEEKYFANQFIVEVLDVILLKYVGFRKRPLVLKYMQQVEVLLAYYQAGRLEDIISMTERVLEREIPKESKIFDINALRDVKYLDKFKKAIENNSNF